MKTSDKLMTTMKALPLGVRLLTVPFLVLVYFGWCVLVLFEYILVFGAVIGTASLFGLMMSPDPYLQVLGASLGSLSTLSSMAALYLRSGFHLQEKGLKILDWMFIAMTLVMMGCFQWIGADPIYWLLFIVFPLLICRAIISYFVRRLPKRIQH